MLHAKVALLGFARDPHSPISRVRVIVGTGNWTTASADHQIEMMWNADIPLGGRADSQLRADVAAVADFLGELVFGRAAGRSLFHPLPDARRVGEMLSAVEGPRSRTRTRFMHTLKDPLMPQVLRRLKLPDGAKKWNWLYVGSGFFEGPGRGAPKVLTDLKQGLENCVTRNADHSAILDPRKPGALGRPGMGEWTRYSPDEELYGNRSLHAKFVAAGRKSGEQNHDVMVYLGSGNLTIPGFLSSLVRPVAGEHARIEAGVVFKVGKVSSEELWGRLLPDGPLIDAHKELAVGEGETEQEGNAIPPPPILFAETAQTDGHGANKLILRKAEPETAAQVLIDGAVLDVPVGTNEIPAPRRPTPYLEVRASIGSPWELVPVVGADGRFARYTPSPGSLQSALEMLMVFPSVPEVEEEMDLAEDGAAPASAPGKSVMALGYPARDAMRIVEVIANAAAEGGDGLERRRALAQRVRDALTEGVKRDEKERLAALGVNFFAALRELPGAPDGPDWNALVGELERDWGLSSMPPLSKRFAEVSARG
jgi:hypothetical protein